MSASQTTKGHIIVLSLVFFFVVILSTEAQAMMFGFYNITGNDPDDAETGEAQLSVVVTDPGGNQVLFTFHNDGTEASSITEIYFMDGQLSLDLSTGITEGPGVNFSEGASPSELPGYPTANWTTFFAADADPPGGGPTGNGINNGYPTGEWLALLFVIDSGYSYNEVITDMTNSNLVIGLHVTSFAEGGSESFITPVPGAVLLGLLGLGVAGVKLRKFA